MNFWCWHDWSKWQTYKFVGISYGTSGYLITGDTSPRQISETRQARKCLKCGMEIHRRVPSANGSMYAEPQTV